MRILSRIRTIRGVGMLVITITDRPDEITHCIVQRRILNSCGTNYTYDALSITYLLEMGGPEGKYQLALYDVRHFNIQDWTMKAFVRKSSAELHTTRSNVAVYEKVLDLTRDLISGFQTLNNVVGQSQRASTATLNILRLTLEPQSCTRVRLIWNCASCLESTSSATPRNNCAIRTESEHNYNYRKTNEGVQTFHNSVSVGRSHDSSTENKGNKGGATGFLIHVIEWCDGGSEWFVTSEFGDVIGLCKNGRKPFRASELGEAKEWGVGSDLVLPIDLKSGSRYTIRTSPVYMKEFGSNDHKFTAVHSTGANFISYRAEHTFKELQHLLHKAGLIRNPFKAPSEFLPCLWLYRHKPPEYYADIFNYHGGIMHPYLKDRNGDQGSCINGILNVLYFSADVDFKTRQPRELPVFGKERLSLSSFHILRRSRLYFADVYCLDTKPIHYITLVLTTPGSAADVFCAIKLVELNTNGWASNPYLFIHEDRVYVTSRVHVEVLFTDSVDIGWYLRKGLGVLEIIRKGSFEDHNWKHDGRPKDSQCQLCNQLV